MYTASLCAQDMFTENKGSGVLGYKEPVEFFLPFFTLFCTSKNFVGYITLNFEFSFDKKILK
jgi:hypothetical protein